MQFLQLAISILNKMPLQGWRVYIVNTAIVVAAVFSELYGADLSSVGSAIGFALSGMFMRHTLSKYATQVGYTNALLEQLVAAEQERRAAENSKPAQGDAQ